MWNFSGFAFVFSHSNVYSPFQKHKAVLIHLGSIDTVANFHGLTTSLMIFGEFLKAPAPEGM